MNSVREHIAHIQRRMRDDNVTPAQAREDLATLTGLYGNCLNETRAAEIEWIARVSECYAREGKANRAEMAAKSSPEYRRLREAKDTQELCDKMIGSLKVVIRSIDEELRLAR